MTAADIRARLAADAAPEVARAFTDLISDFLATSTSGQGPVAPSLAPEVIARRFVEPLPPNGQELREVLDRVRRDVMSDVNHLSHPMYLGHQVSAPLPLGVWADALISSINNSLAVNEMSPTISHVERRVVRWMCDLIGWDERAGGTFTSGGTEASFTALLAARAVVLPDGWEHGIGAEPPVMLCGEHTHYAVSRAAGELGIGVRNVITVATHNYRMSPEALRRQLQKLRESGRRVLAVVATSGQTATGAFDDLDAIGSICRAFDAWLHVDGAHGATALFSAAHRWRMRGIEHAHSLAWDPHKMMLLPLAAGTVLVREERWLDAAFRQRAPYIFGDSAEATSWNIGPRSFQCSRRGDALKTWIVLQRYGTEGMAAVYDLLCSLAQALHRLVAAHPDFEVLHEPDCNILCFRWVGAGDKSPTELNELNGTLRERYNASGEGWITGTILDDRRVLRATVMNPHTTTGHLERLLEGLSRTAHQMTAHSA
ncbi:MAG: pyridoxal phosphate-dependent decarboxylase family protein [Gemmatimonadaceae bacterium]